MKRKIHIFGAAGSGTTTIAKRVCEIIGYQHFDADDYFWLSTDDPFTIERPRKECLSLMKNDLSSDGKWVLSGSLSGWGDDLIPLFDLVVFVYVPQDIRLERLRKREHERYGDEIICGGVRYEATEAFFEWAAAYDAGTRNGRSLPIHENLLKSVRCPVLRITNHSFENSVDTVLEAIGEQ